MVDLILWIVAAVLVVAGVVTMIRRGFVWGMILIVVGLLVGPGWAGAFR